MLNALWIVLVGMVIIFAILGILLLAMILLGKLFQPSEEKKRNNS